jgi:hypothetical protein
MYAARLRRLFRRQPTAESIERMVQMAIVELLESAAHFWMWDAAWWRSSANSGTAETATETTRDSVVQRNASAWAYKFLTYEAAYLSVCNEYGIDTHAVLTHSVIDMTRTAARLHAPTLEAAHMMDSYAPTVEQAVEALRATLISHR